jgi:NADPH:quinone reductase
MQVATIHGQGKSAVLKITTALRPILTKNHVLIKTCAAGLNRADILQRLGLYAPPPLVTGIPGLEVSGEIVEVGTNVPKTWLGNTVCALLAGGGYAEYVAVPVSHVLPVPKNISVEEAAALPEACATVWYNLFMKAKLQKGETLLVHGGSSGIGSMAIQVANALGIECYTTAGTDEKCHFAEKIGAKKAFNYRTGDFVESILAATGGKGVHVILDMVGGSYVQKNITVLLPKGRLVSIAFLAGAKTEVNMAPLLMKNLTWMGTTLRHQPAAVKKKIMAEVQRNLWPLLESGQIIPIIDCVFAFNEAMEAQHYMEKGVHRGKILLRL